MMAMNAAPKTARASEMRSETPRAIQLCGSKVCFLKAP